MYSSLQGSGDARRLHQRIYAGEILRMIDMPSMQVLVQTARGMLEEALHPWWPPQIHRYLNHTEQTLRFAQCQSAFASCGDIHRCWQAVLEWFIEPYVHCSRRD